MGMSFLQAALEGLSSDEAGAFESSSVGSEDGLGAAANEGGASNDPSNALPGGDLQVLIEEATTTLESHYADTDEVFCQADQLRDYVEENEQAHQVLREDVKDLRNTLEAVTGSMEMLNIISSMETIEPAAIQIANVALESLARQLNMVTPSLEAIDGKLTQVSQEGLIDFLKATGTKIKNWFGDMFDRMTLSTLRERTTYAHFEARVKRIQGILSKLPQDIGKPIGAIQYKDPYLWGLYADGKPLPFTQSALSGAVKESASLSMMGITANATEHLANIKVINSTLPSLLMSIGDDGGEKATRAMVEKLKLTTTLPKDLKYGTEQPGGVTYREGNYRPSVRVASWAQIMVEMVERDRCVAQFRRTGRSGIDMLEPKEMEAILDEIIDHIGARQDRAEGFWGELVESYNDSVAAYNKTLGLAHATDHSELTSEVWKALDLASYVMMQLYDIIIREGYAVGIPAGRVIDSVLYVIEEQLVRYVKVNRQAN